MIQQLLSLEWVYQDAAPERVSQAALADVVPPSVDTLKLLLDYAEDGDIRAIKDALDELERDRADLALFVAQFQQLARAFQLNRISALLQGYLEE